MNGSRLGLYTYNERLQRVTGMPPIVIPTHWDNFSVPYRYSQEASITRNIQPFIKSMADFSPRIRVITPKHLGTIIVP